MSEKLIDILKRLAKILHWLGKYEECNQLTEVIKLMNIHRIETTEELREFMDTVPCPARPDKHGKQF